MSEGQSTQRATAHLKKKQKAAGSMTSGLPGENCLRDEMPLRSRATLIQARAPSDVKSKVRFLIAEQHRVLPVLHRLEPLQKHRLAAIVSRWHGSPGADRRAKIAGSAD